MFTRSSVKATRIASQAVRRLSHESEYGEPPVSVKAAFAVATAGFIYTLNKEKGNTDSKVTAAETVGKVAQQERQK